MVYDAGFLALPADFFLVEILSSEERKKMKMHVNFAANYLDFIPKEYWDIFHDASTMHHENMNGSGYPEGVSGMDIPHIARIIHVVESYVSLVSKRSYHKMFDKEGALAELRRLPGLYDGEVVDVLEQIV
jgi:HD-GYP domain-containing protein (c-di-GMP phosphodiesterase class II)